MKIVEIPSCALVVLVGAAGSGKSTFARAHFRETEILSSDAFRGLVSDDEGDQEATADAFALLHAVLEMRLRRAKVCVVDATNVRVGDRAKLIAPARRFGRTAVAIVFETPESVCVARAGGRTGRAVSADIVRRQIREMPREVDDLLNEGFAIVWKFSAGECVDIRK